MISSSTISEAKLLSRSGLAVLCHGTWGWRCVLFVLGVVVGLLHAARCFPALAAHGFDWPMGFDGDVGSLATYGKWWVLPPHHYLTDGFSGDLPTYYNYLSDVLINVLAASSGLPSLTVQAVVYGPVLAALFFWCNAASLRLVTHERGASLVGALLMSLSSGSGLLQLLLTPEKAAEISISLHVPVRALAYGTSQSLGWVLFLPALALFYGAHEKFSRRGAIACGVLTGLMPHVHTLTFINLALGQVACATGINATRLPAGRRRQLWLSGLAVLALAFLARVVSGPFSTLALGVFGALALLVNFAVSPSRRLYVWVYGVAGVVMLPYALAVFRGRGPAVMLAQVGGFAVSPGLLLAFYAAHVAAAMLVLSARVPRSVLVFFGSLLTVTFFLSCNGTWGWNNHPYRFAINLVFPLCGLAALGLIRGGRRLALVAAVWLGAIVAMNVAGLASSTTTYGQTEVFGANTADFLAKIREVTAESPGDTTLLNPPEYDYPRGVHENTLLFSYSQRPGFVPDYRYLLDREPYFNRLALFCFLFPEYPAVDAHLASRRACDEPLDPPQDLVVLREARLRTAILPVYGVRYAAALGTPFSEDLARSEAQYGWEVLVEFGRKRRLVRFDPPNLPGLARLERMREGPLGQILRFRVSGSGNHTFVLGGRRLRERVSRMRLDGHEAPEATWRDNWSVFEASLQAGTHELVLERAEREPGGARDVLYFVTIVEQRLAANYLAIASGPQ